MPIISIIVPVYNVEPYLRQCVDSILQQTFTDFELILVDDGSPDNCPAICDEYAAADKRVHVIHQKNGGLSAARNAGIDWAFAHSKSEWLSFVDSDDWIHPEMIERLYHAAVEHDVAVSVCGFIRTENDNEAISSVHSCPKELSPQAFYVDYTVNAVIACGKLYRKECFSSIRYPVGKIHEDEYTTYKILFAESKIVFIPDALYYYRINMQSIMKSAWTIKRMDSIPAVEAQISFFYSGHFSLALETAIKRYLDMLYFNCDQAIKSQAVDKDVVIYLQKKMRKALSRYKKDGAISIKDYPWAYETAYPNFMKFYWRFQSLKRKLGISR